MEKFWKWLLKADAKGLFVASLLLLCGVTAWWGFDLVHAQRKAANAPAEKPDNVQSLELSAFKPIGIIGFVSNQFAPETLIVPVNPFHPTFEAIVKELVRHSEDGVITIVDKDGNTREVHFDDNGVLVDSKGNAVATPFQRDLTPRQPGQGGQQAGGQRPAGQLPFWQRPQGARPQAKPRPAQPKPKPQVSFKGVMQRPDGTFAAYVSIKAEKTQGRFVKVGDRLGNATVTSSGRDGVELTFDDGTKTTLGIGDAPVVLEPDNG